MAKKPTADDASGSSSPLSADDAPKPEPDAPPELLDPAPGGKGTFSVLSPNETTDILQPEATLSAPSDIHSPVPELQRLSLSVERGVPPAPESERSPIIAKRARKQITKTLSLEPQGLKDGQKQIFYSHERPVEETDVAQSKVGSCPSQPVATDRRTNKRLKVNETKEEGLNSDVSGSGTQPLRFTRSISPDAEPHQQAVTTKRAPRKTRKNADVSLAKGTASRRKKVPVEPAQRSVASDSNDSEADSEPSPVKPKHIRERQTRVAKSAQRNTLSHNNHSSRVAKKQVRKRKPKAAKSVESSQSGDSESEPESGLGEAKQSEGKKKESTASVKRRLWDLIIYPQYEKGRPRKTLPFYDLPPEKIKYDSTRKRSLFHHPPHYHYKEGPNGEALVDCVAIKSDVPEPERLGESLPFKPTVFRDLKPAMLDCGDWINIPELHPDSVSTYKYYPFFVPDLPKHIVEGLSECLTAKGQEIKDDRSLHLEYFQPCIPHHLANVIYYHLRQELFFSRVKYDFILGTRVLSETTTRFTSMFGVDDTAYFSPERVMTDKRDGRALVSGPFYSELGHPMRPHYSRRYMTSQPRPLPQCLEEIRKVVEAVTGTTFNVCLVNYYATGSDHHNYHDETQHGHLGEQPIIATLALGAQHKFTLRRQPRHYAAVQRVLPEVVDWHYFTKVNDQDFRSKHVVDPKWVAEEEKEHVYDMKGGDLMVLRGKTAATHWPAVLPTEDDEAETIGRMDIVFKRVLTAEKTEKLYADNVGIELVFRWDEEEKAMLPWGPPGIGQRFVSDADMKQTGPRPEVFSDPSLKILRELERKRPHAKERKQAVGLFPSGRV